MKKQLINQNNINLCKVRLKYTLFTKFISKLDFKINIQVWFIITRLKYKYLSKYIKGFNLKKTDIKCVYK